jgi:cobaltochelatase CobN
LHLLVRETRTLDEEQAAVDLGHAPADLVFLSFADSDLAGAASAWLQLRSALPTLRLASLASLRHPMSVDLYAERVIAHARCVVVRMLGGLDYWRYGAEEFGALCRQHGIALALLSGDGSDDPSLATLSTVSPAALTALNAYLHNGGQENLRQALHLAAQLGGLGEGATGPPAELPRTGEFTLPVAPEGVVGSAVIVFYRAHLLAADIAPIEALSMALHKRGLGVRALHVGSLKDVAAATFVVDRLLQWRPSVVLNVTGFSARQDVASSPLDAADVPVLQLMLSSTPRAAWLASSRGLSQTDLAMQVVLPELDGRLIGAAVGFKSEAEPVPGLEFTRTVFTPDPDGIALAADRAACWASLAATPREKRRVAIMLSDYPGASGGQIGHAVGLDSLASLERIAALLGDAGYNVADPTDLGLRLSRATPTPIFSLTDYRRLFAALPEEVQVRVVAAWGDPSDDASVREGEFIFAHIVTGNLVVAVQPDRGSRLDRKAGYHDPDLPPRHGYVACYLWLREQFAIHALVHLGTHGTLEWLPGKAVAPSNVCFPTVLTAGLPVIYPFIVNNPGEAAAAKRRLGAVTIGHMTPTLRPAGTHGAAVELEHLIDEFATADGLDRRRTQMLRHEILCLARTSGLLAESGVQADAPDEEALARLDAYLCDIKELQIRDGLHIFGCPPDVDRRAAAVKAMQRSCPGRSSDEWAALLDGSAAQEQASLLAALDGRFVVPGPSGAPTRGRPDVLPTGRNLFSVDPRAIPTRAAHRLAERAAGDLLRRHMQDHGDWPRSLMLNLWGSTTMRTGGEDLAMALVLVGARPVWDGGSARVSGIEILPLALLDRPRIDVTLRISGLFRDAFAAQVLLFDTAVRAIAERDEDTAWNPLAAAAQGLLGEAWRQATARVFGTAPGGYGTGVGEMLARGDWADHRELGAAYLASSVYAYGKGLDGSVRASSFAARVAAADGFVHIQDHAEADLLEGLEHASHEGGFAAAASSLGGHAALYRVDTSRPDVVRTRTLAEEIRRVVRGRATNPTWIAGMMRHGYRGASEIARTLDALHAYAATLPERMDAQFDLFFDATLGDPTVDAFLRDANPAARAAMAECFTEAIRRGLWRTQRNAVTALL